MIQLNCDEKKGEPETPSGILPPLFELQRVDPYHSYRKEMMKQFYRDEYDTRKEEDSIGIVKDMRNSYRIAQNLATFNAIPRWKYQSTNNIKVRTNRSMDMGSRGSDVDMTIHDREGRTSNSSMIMSGRNSDRDMTMVMNCRRNGEGEMPISKRLFPKHEKEQAIQEIVEELMHHRRLLESYQQQKKKSNYEKDEATTKGQCISKKIEAFLDSYEEVMKKTQLFDQSDIRFDIDNATCLSTSSNCRGSQQQPQLVRPSKSMTSPAIITTSTTQARKEVQFDLSSTTWHEVNCNDDGTASFIAQRDVSAKRETKYRNVGILRNSRIYRRSLSNKSLDRAQATSRGAPPSRQKSEQKKRVSFGLPSTLKESQEDKKSGSARGEIKGILRKKSCQF